MVQVRAMSQNAGHNKKHPCRKATCATLHCRRWPLSSLCSALCKGARQKRVTAAAAEVAKKLDVLIRNDEESNALASRLFEAHSENGHLTRSTVELVSKSFAIHLGVDMQAPPRRGLAPVKREIKKMLQLDRMDLMFQRFDVNCDALLDEKEVRSLLRFMTRVVREALGIAQPGVERVQGKLNLIHTKSLKARFGSMKHWRKIGQGGQGATFLTTEKSSGLEIVLKRCDSYAGDETEMDNISEFELLKSLKHPRIEHIYDIFRTREHVYIVKEPYYGGDLRTAAWRAAEAGVRVGERWLAGVFQQVLEGVRYLHNNHVIHCDLKEANVMIASSELAAPQIKVIDFGLAFRFDGNVTWRGSGHYTPPEASLKGIWTPRGDVFSIGVMMFVMASGEYPYNLSDDMDCKQTAPSLSCQTERLSSLVRRMIDRDLEKRPCIASIMQDDWFVHGEGDRSCLTDEVLQKLSVKSHESILCRALLASLAQRMHLGHLSRLNDLFVQLDADDDGTITEDELRDKLRGEMSQDEIERVISHFMGASGRMDYHEFIGLLIAEKAADETELLRQIFDDADQNGNGALDECEVQQLLADATVESVLSRAGASEYTEVVKQMRAASSREDGQIDFHAFAHVLQVGSLGMQGCVKADVAREPAPEISQQTFSVGDVVRIKSKRMALVNAFRFTKGRHHYMRLMNHMLGQEYRVHHAKNDVIAIKPSWLSAVTEDSAIWFPVRAASKVGCDVGAKRRVGTTTKKVCRARTI